MSCVLHYAPDNASPVIRLALEQVVLYQCTLVDRSQAAQRSEAYKALNPNELISTLETDMVPIFETGAILLWLADRHGGLGPAPDSDERADFLKWLYFVSNTLHPALCILFYPDQFIGSDPALHAILRENTCSALQAHHMKLNTLAAQRHDWCNGEAPSALDLYIAATLRWPAIYPMNQDRSWHSLANYPALRDMCQCLESLPLIKSLIQSEGRNTTPFINPSAPNPPEGSEI